MENVIDSDQAAEMLGISKNNLRQLVYRKLLVPVGKQKRRSLFNVEDVAKVKEARKPLIPSV
jgi:DNA-binding transcriptional MerR regulator